MSGMIVLIIGSDSEAFCSVRHAIEESGRILIIEGKISDLHEDTRALESLATECEPIYFKNYDYYDEKDCKLELDDKPIYFNRKPVINYQKPILKPRFVRRGNRGK